MRLLLDTNVLIALEPALPGAGEPGLVLAAELARLASVQGHQLIVHPATIGDLARDKRPERAETRRQVLKKYVELVGPPPITTHIETVAGRAEQGTNDWVDHALLAALMGDAVDYLVTEDRGLHSKAHRLEIENRVLTVSTVVSVLRDLYDTTPEPPPSVRAVACHELDASDAIWDSLRDDYPDFDAWFTACKRRGRPAWVVDSAARHAGVAIIKPDQDPGEYGLVGKTLKLCTMKVCSDFNGNRFGELLLRAVFDYAFENGFEQIVTTVFPRQWELIGLLGAFGFFDRGANERGERVMAKRLLPRDEEVQELDGLEFNIRFGPQAVKVSGERVFIVPIRPTWHRLLFPELEMSGLDGCRPCGNSIRKAYLSHSATRTVGAGAVLLFYRSQDWRAVDVVGVVEDVLCSQDANEVARFVGRSTVFDYDSIQRLCSRSETIALRFRQATILGASDRLHYRTLKENGVINGPPMTIQALAGGEQWLKQQIPLLY